MTEIDIHALERDVVAVVAAATAGAIVTITENGRRVALVTPIGPSRLVDLRAIRADERF